MAIIRLAIAVLAACATLAAAPHHGQVRFGGLPVPGATITATSGERRLTTISDQQGEYAFAELADGLWTVRVEMQCFAPLEREVAIAANAPSPVWELKLLALEEMKAEMKASAAPPPPAAAAPPAAAKTKTKLPKGVPPPQPANTPSGFQHTEANAAADAPKPDAASPGGPANEMGQQPSDGFLINGSVNNGQSTPFAQAAAFGNFRKGPRSLYNGSLGLSFDNAFWDARSFSLTGQDTPKPGYSHFQGMASFGGPIDIPRLGIRNGPHVMLNYQWLRNRNATTQTARVPTEAERRGEFPGNTIPQSLISPQARALLAFYPLPNFQSAAGYNYQVPLTGSTHQDSLQSRVNKGIGKKDSVSGSFAAQSTRGDSTGIFGFLDTTGSLGTTTSVNWMHRFGMRMFSTLGFQFSRQSNRTTPFFAGRSNVSGLAGIAGNNQEPANWGPPTLTFASGIATLSDGQNAALHNQTGGVTASLFWTHGAHNVTAGADARRQQFNTLSQQDPRGTFTFTGAATGIDFAGFLLGIPDASSIAFGNADKYFRAGSYDAYINDDWRLGSSVTINGGLRWEFGTPVTERYGRLVNLDVASGFTAIAPVVAARYAGSLIDPYRRAIQPRIGLSWRPILASSLVIRAGYGVYYDTSIYMAVATRMAQQSPLSKSLSVANSAANPLTLANGFSAPPNVTTNTFAVDPHFRPGYAQIWQLSMQRDLPHAMVATASYIGTKGTHSQQQFLPQTWPSGAAAPCPSCPSGYQYLTSNGNSTRESGQLQIRRRLASGMAAQLSYTFSKSIDDAALGGHGGGAAVIAQDWLNLSGERGLSNFDQRHLLKAQVEYTSGMGLRGGTLTEGWKGRLTQDWTFTTNINAGSGLPLTPVYLSVVRGTGVTGSIRPDYTVASLYDAPAGMFLNPAAVTAPAPGHWGNAGRGSIGGPGQFTLSASMGRTFRVSERLSADFRLDCANAFNHVTFAGWNVVATSPQFGLATAANPMRSVQANLRVRF